MVSYACGYDGGCDRSLLFGLSNLLLERWEIP